MSAPPEEFQKDETANQKNNDMQDLFETPETWPAEVAAILLSLPEDAEYTDLENARIEVQAHGYDFDYDLSATPFGLKKIFF